MTFKCINGYNFPSSLRVGADKKTQQKERITTGLPILSKIDYLVFSILAALGAIYLSLEMMFSHCRLRISIVKCQNVK